MSSRSNQNYFFVSRYYLDSPIVQSDGKQYPKLRRMDREPSRPAFQARTDNLSRCCVSRGNQFVTEQVRGAGLKLPRLFAFQPQELSRFFDGPEYLNVTAVQYLIHACDSVVHVCVDYDCASRTL